MQKLLQRSPSSPLLSSSSSSFTSSCLSFNPFPFTNKPTSSGFPSFKPIFLPFSFPLTKPFSSMPMPVAPLSGTLGRCGGLAACVARKPNLITPTLPSTNYFTFCRCATENRAVQVPSRAWFVARPAWYNTTVVEVGPGGPVSSATAAAIKGVKSGEDVEEKEGKGTVRVNSRRHRGGGSEVMENNGNADLLTIPGVGPKNLKKLVEKGFRGMAELKQLYKDKV